MNLVPYLAMFVVLAPVLTNPVRAQSLEDEGWDYARDYATTCAEARAAAERDVSSMWYLAGGCLFETGVLIAYLVSPSPPMSSLIGKPPEYVAVYSDCYRAAGRSAQGKRALVGCAVTRGLSVILYMLLIIIFPPEPEPY